MPTTDQAGIRRTATYWVEEVQSAGGDPQTPTDPAFKLWSKSVESAGTESSSEYEESLGLGNDVAHTKNRGVESHDISVSYELNRFPEDSAGNVQDPFGYAALRNADNRLQETLTYLQVIERGSLALENTVHYRYFTDFGNTHPGTDPGATAGRASRTEIYGRGGRPDDPELSANPGDSAVIEVDMSLMMGKVRKYQIDQPDSGKYIHVRSTASGDTDVPVDIETTDGATSETITTDSTDGTTAVPSANTYDSLRVHVDGAFDGTIEIYQDDGSGTSTDPEGAPGELLTYIRGANSYDGIEADRGVPMVGAGSFESEGSLGDALSALKTAGSFDGSDAAQQIMGSTVSVSNNLEDLTPAGTLTRDIHAGQREIESNSTVYGEAEGVRSFQDHIEGREGELRLPTTGGDIVMPRVYVSEGGDTEREEGSAVMQVDVTFRALRPTDGSDPLQFQAA